MNISEIINNQYYPLHVHTTTGSIGDSILKIDKYIEKAKSLKIDKLCITNHGSLSDMYDFYAQCIDNKIKPIIGCEVYEADDMHKSERQCYHLVLIAKNKIGLKNLIKITSDANIEGFFFKPRVDLELMSKYSEGIIALSACVGGKIPQMILNDEPEEDILNRILKYKKIFKEFYLEIQPGDFVDQQITNKNIIRYSDMLNIPIVVTNDIHYLNKEDWLYHDLHVKSQRKMNYNDKMVYPDKCYYFMEYEEIVNAMSKLGVPSKKVNEGLKNAKSIANSIEDYEIDSSIKFPVCDIPAGLDEKSYLYILCYKRLNQIKNTLKDPALYIERLEYEMDTICGLGYAGYFLVVRDFIMASKKKNVEIGPGRGSVCGSLIAFLLGITQVDPIKYNLLFERFLSPYRKGSVPDIDIDFESSRRNLIFKYVVEKYGKEKCALVSTFGMRKARASIKDAARVFEIDNDMANETSKMIPSVWYDNGEKQTDLDIEDALKVVPELRTIQSENEEWFKMAINLENLPRHTSIHAAGTLISPIDLTEYIPLTKPNNDYIYATSLDLKSAESAGAINKMVATKVSYMLELPKAFMHL